MDFAGLEELRMPKAIAKPPESLESFQVLETLSSLMGQKTLNKPEQLDKTHNTKRKCWKH